MEEFRHDDGSFSKRICSKLTVNADHGLVVYGMVLSSLPKSERRRAKECRIKRVKLIDSESKEDEAKIRTNSKSNNNNNKKIPLQCDLSYVVCDRHHGDVCEMKDCTYRTFFDVNKYVGRRSNSDDVETGFIRFMTTEVYQDVLAPKWHWFVTDFAVVTITVFVVGLAYGTYGYGASGLTEWLQRHQDASSSSSSSMAAMLSSVVSPSRFGTGIVRLWYVTFSAHLLETMYFAFYRAAFTLRLRPSSVLHWAVLIMAAGFDASLRIRNFVRMRNSLLQQQQQQQQEKRQKDETKKDS